MNREGMIYLKSVFAGIVAVVLSFCLLIVGIVIYLWITAPEAGGVMASDPISVIKIGPLLVILGVFVAGFLWEFRRASR